MQEINDLHARCGVYTQPSVVNKMLDSIGWQSTNDLPGMRLLEPAAGQGVFVIEAARRLVDSCRARGIKPTTAALKGCIRAYEIHPQEAQRSKKRLIKAICELGIHQSTAKALAQAWVKNGDFLLASMETEDLYTHVVGNPPYIRWSKIPTNLKKKYNRKLSVEMTGGDLFLPFLDRSLEQLQINGKCAFLCSDRWRFMAFAESFRTKWLPLLEIESETSVLAPDVYIEDVDTYPSVLIAKRRPVKKRMPNSRGTQGTLKDSGFVVKVGPALGHAPAFVLEPTECDVEPQLLRPWVHASEIFEGLLVSQGKKIVAMNDENGKLLDLARYPLLAKRLRRFKKQLQKRSIVRNGAPWFKPIDRINAAEWSRPKLLIPEISKVPRLVLDRSGAIPSHGVYAIFGPEEKIDALYAKLAGGGLAKALIGITPQIKGGYYRCYKRFLDMMILD